ncbi:MAG: VWA domain-containing protein [Oligosphaeraceae bacterium]
MTSDSSTLPAIRPIRDITPMPPCDCPLPHCPIILVLDTSHSMWGKGLSDMVSSLKVFYQTLHDEDIPQSIIDIAAVSMGSNLGMLEDFTPFEQSVLPTLTIRPKGYTPIGGALALAMRRLEQQRASYQASGIAHVKPYLILLSDGQDSEDDFSAIASQIRSACQSGSLRCWAIAMGDNPDLDALRTIAGDAIFRPVYGDLRHAFAQVGKQVSETYVDEAATSSVTSTASPDGFQDSPDITIDIFSDSTPDVTSSSSPRATVSPCAPATYASPITSTGPDYILDGSNIIYWDKEIAPVSLNKVLAITRELDRQGKTYLVFFDATVRYKLSTSERQQLESLFTNRPQQFRLAPAGTAADEFILRQADAFPHALIITNDLYRQYSTTYAWLNSEKRLAAGMLLGNALCISRANLNCQL